MANQMFPNAPINNPFAATQIGPEAAAQQYKMAYRQRLADMLTQQGMQEPQGQMVSGHYVAPSPLQYLSGLANTGLGAKYASDMPQQQSEYNQMLSDQLRKTAGQMTGQAPMTNPQANASALANGGGPTNANAQMAGQYQSGAAAPLAGIDQSVVENIMQYGGPQQIAEFIRQVNNPTDLQKTDRYLQIDPNQSRALELGKRLQQGYIAPVKVGPGEALFDPLKPNQQIVSMPKDGIHTSVGPNNVATASPVQNHSKIVSAQESDKAASTSYGNEIGKSSADADKVLYEAAQNAPKQFDTANRIIDLVNDGALTGTGAEITLKAAKALNVVGVDNKDIIRKTELLFSSLAQNTLDSIKTSGLGAGQGFTDKDREFLEKAKGGNITLDATTLKEMARLQKLAAQNSVDAFNTRYKDMPESSRTTGWKPVEIKNRYSQSELRQELQRRKAQQGAQ